MDERIFGRIQQLGGTVKPATSSSLFKQLQAISLARQLFHKDWDVYSVEQFHAENLDLYSSNRELFITSLITQLRTVNPNKAVGQQFWECSLFTPMTAGTANYKEWGSWFLDGNAVDLTPIRALVGDGELQFVLTCTSYGYPDHFYICLQDPNPANPTVFGTDHEVFFSEISNRGSLLDFLNNFQTDDDMRQLITNYLAHA